MKKWVALVAGLGLASCSGGEQAEEAPAVAVAAGLYADEAGRSGMCVAEGGEASFILYAAQGSSNCMAEGRVETGEGGVVFAPDGDERCRFPLSVDGSSLRFGEAPASCDYYCGGSAAIDDRMLLSGGDTTSDPVDPAGDPLC